MSAQSAMAANVPTLGARPQSRKHQSRKAMLIGIAFIAPNLLGFIVFFLGPMLYGLYISFTDWDLLNDPKWVGLDNYNTLIHDDLMWKSLKNTFIYCLVTIPGGMAVALSLAMAVKQAARLAVLYRSLMFLPVVTSTIAVALVWKSVLNTDFGLLNWLLEFVGVSPIGWLSDTRWAMISVGLVAIWKNMGYNMVIFLAGLHAVPQHLYEAAAIDGAGAWRRFRNVTLPMISPTLFFVLIVSVIGSFQVFDQVYVLTDGGPGNSTVVYNYYLYQNAFEFFRMGYASAMAYALFALIFLITVFQVKFLNKRVQYDQM
ncbi:MAG: carbohydrate ABC transporter permease [Thermomicrobiales bacterium]